LGGCQAAVAQKYREACLDAAPADNSGSHRAIAANDPTTGIAGYCARAASGHATAAPPIIVAPKSMGAESSEATNAIELLHEEFRQT
jgi:hypothetical protein